MIRPSKYSLTAGAVCCAAFLAARAIPAAVGQDGTDEPELAPATAPNLGQDAAPQVPGGRPTLDVVVDATRTAAGVLDITLTYRGLDPTRAAFKPVGIPGEYKYEAVQFLDESGKEVGYKVDNSQYVPSPYVGDVLTIRYELRPGGLGRHGHQGYADPEYAMVDGRAYLLPRGMGSLGPISVRFALPDGWQVASPFRQDGDQWRVDWWGDEVGPDVLLGACVGLGPFQGVEKPYGDSTLRVFTYAPWDDEHKAVVVDKTTKIFEYFHNQYGMSQGNGAPYAVVWTPQPSEANRLFGGSSASGACFEQPVDRHRNWQLLAHRYGHAMNKYVPTGYSTTSKADHWYIEGWASWAEVDATENGGVRGANTHFNELFRRYNNVVTNYPDQDLALADERMSSGDGVEYLHYTKAPLVVAMLDDHLKRHANKSLAAYSKHVAQTFGHYQRALPLREDLGAWAGIDLAPFWNAFVDQPGGVIPVWDAYVTDDMAAARSAVGSVGSMPVDEDYLFHLARVGAFERFSDIVAFVEDEAWHRQRLAQHGVDLAPPSLRKVLHGVPPEVRYNLAVAEASWHTPPVAAAGGCGGGGAAAPKRQALSLDLNTPGGKVFSQLLAEERRYHETQASAGVTFLSARGSSREDFRKLPDRLGLLADERVVLVAEWAQLPGRANFQVWRDGEMAFEKSMSLEPGWTRTWSTFEAKDRPSGSGLVTFRVRANRKTLAERTFWQR